MCNHKKTPEFPASQLEFHFGFGGGRRAGRGFLLWYAWHTLATSTILRTLEFLGLGIWLGSDVFLSFVVAPGAFSVLASRDQAGAIVGYSLTRMHILGVVCGLLVLLFRVLRTRGVAILASPASIAVLGMIVLTVCSQLAVSPRMAALRARMGSIEATSAASPLLAEFSRLHRASVSLESGVLLSGFAAFYLLVREIGRSFSS